MRLIYKIGYMILACFALASPRVLSNSPKAKSPAISVKSKEKPQIRIILSAALLDSEFDVRKGHYIKSINALREYGYENPYIVDSVKPKGPTFLDDYSTHVLYSHVNDARLLNKGVNEASSLIAAFKHFDFNDDDMIIKMTGRYYFASRNFLDAVEQNPNVDAFVRVEKNGNILTGCFGLRCKYFKEMLDSINLERMEKDLVCIETLVGNYLIRARMEHDLSILYLDKLHIAANVWGWGKNHFFQYQ